MHFALPVVPFPVDRPAGVPPVALHQHGRTPAPRKLLAGELRVDLVSFRLGRERNRMAFALYLAMDAIPVIYPITQILLKLGFERGVC